MRFLIAFVLSVLMTVAAYAQGVCESCNDAEHGAHNPVQRQSGGPDKALVCFYVSMPDPCDSVVVASIDASGAATTVEDFHRGAAVNFAQKDPFELDEHGKQIVQCSGKEKAMVCVHRSRITTATTALRLIPGDRGTCHTLKRDRLDDLLKHGSWGPKKALRLGWSAVGATTAPGKP